MKKVIFGIIFLFLVSFTLESCGTRARPGCKDNAKKVKKLRKSGQIKM